MVGSIEGERRAFDLNNNEQGDAMQYEGKLYGKWGGRRYFDTGRTSCDWDRMEHAIRDAMMHLEASYDADGDSMKESDAYISLRRGLCAEHADPVDKADAERMQRRDAAESCRCSRCGQTMDAPPDPICARCECDLDGRDR